MSIPYAEVIGDPIAQSRSPVIHHHWLDRLGQDGEFRATQVVSADLAAFFAARRTDPSWRGCNVTVPHKIAVLPFLDRLAGPEVERIGAVNCIARDGDALVGHNTDIDGVAEALAGADFSGRAVLIGAGGAARPALVHLIDQGVRDVILLARDPAKAEPLRALAPGRIAVAPMEDVSAMAGAAMVINATPLGLDHAGPMPAAILAAIGDTAPAALVMDMVYRATPTPLLAAAKEASRRPVGGLSMLIGQARRAFEVFFGATPPRDDEALVRLLLA